MLQYCFLDVVNDQQIQVELPVKPYQVWTVIDKPKLCLEINEGGKPRHLHTAFMEDWWHDWQWKNGIFRFYGHSGKRGDKHELLLVYKDLKNET